MPKEDTPNNEAWDRILNAPTFKESDFDKLENDIQYVLNASKDKALPQGVDQDSEQYIDAVEEQRAAFFEQQIEKYEQSGNTEKANDLRELQARVRAVDNNEFKDYPSEEIKAYQELDAVASEEAGRISAREEELDDISLKAFNSLGKDSGRDITDAILGRVGFEDQRIYTGQKDLMKNLVELEDQYRQAELTDSKGNPIEFVIYKEIEGRGGDKLTVIDQEATLHAYAEAKFNRADSDNLTADAEGFSATTKLLKGDYKSHERNALIVKAGKEFQASVEDDIQNFDQEIAEKQYLVNEGENVQSATQTPEKIMAARLNAIVGNHEAPDGVNLDDLAVERESYNISDAKLNLEKTYSQGQETNSEEVTLLAAGGKAATSVIQQG